MTIVTSGGQSTDIDTLACGIAYGELLKLQGIEVKVALNPEFTESVTASIKSWGFSFLDLTQAKATPADDYIIVDYSNPAFVPEFVDIKKIRKLFDHHFFGFEKDWEYLGTNAKIEPVGSCASLIWREWQAAGKLAEMSQVSARLLYAAIISNTLNL